MRSRLPVCRAACLSLIPYMLFFEGGGGRAGDNYSAPCEIKLSRIERCRVAVLLNSCAEAKSSSLLKSKQ